MSKSLNGEEICFMGLAVGPANGREVSSAVMVCVRKERRWNVGASGGSEICVYIQKSFRQPQIRQWQQQPHHASDVIWVIGGLSGMLSATDYENIRQYAISPASLKDFRSQGHKERFLPVVRSHASSPSLLSKCKMIAARYRYEWLCVKSRK